MVEDKEIQAKGGAGPSSAIAIYNRDFTKAKNTLVGKKVVHVPTTGATLGDKISKGFSYVIAYIKDLFINVQAKSVFNPYNTDRIAQNGNQLLIKTILKHSDLMSNTDLMNLSSRLNGQLSAKKGSQADEPPPAMKIDVKGITGNMGGGAPSDTIPQIITDEKELANKEQRPIRNLIAYPYMFPSTGVLSFNHIVLVVVDLQNKKIYYYDPQGKTGDDPSRPKFQDGTNMHQNLVDLAKKLDKDHPGDWEVIENTAQHQAPDDAVNCGNYVMRAMVGLSKINQAHLQNADAVQGALSFDKESGELVRKKIGLLFFSQLGLELSKRFPEK